MTAPPDPAAVAAAGRDHAEAEPVPAVAQSIRIARRIAGLSQAQLAARLGVTQTAVSYWESGKRGMTVANLLQVAAELGCPASVLLPLEHQATP